MVKSATQQKLLEWDVKGKQSDVLVKGVLSETKWRYLLFLIPIFGFGVLLWGLVGEYLKHGFNSVPIVYSLILVGIFVVLYLTSLFSPRKIWYQLRKEELLVYFGRTKPLAYPSKDFDIAIGKNLSKGFFSVRAAFLLVPYQNIASITKSNDSLILVSKDPYFFKSVKVILPKDNAKDIEQFLATKTKFLQMIKKR